LRNPGKLTETTDPPNRQRTYKIIQQSSPISPTATSLRPSHGFGRLHPQLRPMAKRRLNPDEIRAAVEAGPPPHSVNYETDMINYGSRAGEWQPSGGDHVPEDWVGDGTLDSNHDGDYLGMPYLTSSPAAPLQREGRRAAASRRRSQPVAVNRRRGGGAEEARLARPSSQHGARDRLLAAARKRREADQATRPPTISL